MEDEEWNWDDVKKMTPTLKEPNLKLLELNAIEQSIGDWENEMVDDNQIKGSRLLSDVYQRCNIAVCEPTDYEEVEFIAAVNQDLFFEKGAAKRRSTFVYCKSEDQLADLFTKSLPVAKCEALRQKI